MQTLDCSKDFVSSEQLSMVVTSDLMDLIGSATSTASILYHIGLGQDAEELLKRCVALEKQLGLAPGR